MADLPISSEIAARTAVTSAGCALIGVTAAQSCIVLGPRLKALRNAGFQVTLISSPGPHLDRTVAIEGVDCVQIQMEREIAPVTDLISLVKIWRLVGRLKPNLVEFGTPKMGLLGILAAALRRVPTRVYLLRGLRLETSHGLKRKLLIAAERVTCSLAHVVLCNSVSLREKALELNLAPAEKLRVLGGGSSIGVDMERFFPGASPVRKRLGWCDNAPVIGFVGRLTRDKGLPELIEAFDCVLKVEPEARLLLVGWFDKAEDAVSPGLRAQIKNHPRIHVTGFVEDTAPYYRALDVMVLPTWREGFPNVVLEAQASAVPVVTTFATGSRDSVVPEVTGLLIPPGYPDAIAEAALKLLRDPVRRRRMGKAARAWVLEHYVEQRVLGLTAEFYRGTGAHASQGWKHAVAEMQSAL